SAALRFSSGNQGGYAGTSRVTRSFNLPTRTDTEVSGTFTHDGNEAYPIVVLRGSTSGVDFNNGYFFRFSKDGALRVGRVVSFSGTTLDTGTVTPSSNTTYGFRFRCVDDDLQGRIWTGGSEPGTWDV